MILVPVRKKIPPVKTGGEQTCVKNIPPVETGSKLLYLRNY